MRPQGVVDLPWHRLAVLTWLTTGWSARNRLARLILFADQDSFAVLPWEMPGLKSTFDRWGPAESFAFANQPCLKKVAVDFEQSPKPSNNNNHILLHAWSKNSKSFIVCFLVLFIYIYIYVYYLIIFFFLFESVLTLDQLFQNRSTEFDHGSGCNPLLAVCVRFVRVSGTAQTAAAVLVWLQFVTEHSTPKKNEGLDHPVETHEK